MATPRIPDELKADMPPSRWGKLLAATPVVMAVIATLLAGLSSSEMTRAQYDRSLAAQQQSKAGDQWSYFQAKKLRGALQLNTLDVVRSANVLHPVDPDALRQLARDLPADAGERPAEILALLDSPAAQQALTALRSGNLPALPAKPTLDPRIAGALRAVAAGKPDPEVTPLIATLPVAELESARRAAQESVEAFDRAMTPTVAVIDRLNEALGRLGASGTALTAQRDFIAARLRLTARRYEAEAQLNQTVANLYELQVRHSNFTAERHRLRSQRFFFGMLAAQAGVIISTLAMAARQRNLLWSLAAVAGLLAVAFAIYVYLYI